MFRCSWGYRLSGPPGLECLASGHWSGPIPRCRGKHLVNLYPNFKKFLMLIAMKLQLGSEETKRKIIGIEN